MGRLLRGVLSEPAVLERDGCCAFIEMKACHLLLKTVDVGRDPARIARLWSAQVILGFRRVDAL